jgi:hypothetical protein
VNSAEENRANFCKSLAGKLLLRALYGMLTVALIELKAVSAQAKESDAVNQTSLESMAQDDDFREVEKCKRHNYSDTSQSAKKSTKAVPTTAAVTLPPEAVSTSNILRVPQNY